MRIDKFFKLSRIIKRRTEAKRACDDRCIKINGKIAKAGDVIKNSDKIEIHFRDRILEIEVLEVPPDNKPILNSARIYRKIREEKILFE